MPSDVVYSPASPLASPGTFIGEAARSLRPVPGAAWRMARRNLAARYRQSWLGYLWLVLPAAAMTALWVSLNRAGVISDNDTDVPYALFVVTGVVLWQLFAEVLDAPLSRLAESRAVLKWTRLPHETWILAGLLEVLFGAVMRLLVVMPVLIWTGVVPGWQLALLPLGLLALVALGAALGLAAAPLGLLYGDVGRGVALVTGLWFFLTPVIYSPPNTGAAEVLVRLNPVTPVLTTTRDWLTSGHDGFPAGFALVTAGATALLVVAWLIYRVAQPHVVARL